MRILVAILILGSTILATSAWTSAYFSDVEVSQNNSFSAGDIDLLVESVCHYWFDGTDIGCGDGPEFGNWELGNLGEIYKFFNFDDIKPGDYGENTISLQVNTNDAWVCSDLTLTSSQENGLTEPESLVDTPDDGLWDGELDQNLTLLYWADDGDNVLEDDEYATESSVLATMSSLTGGDNIYTLPLADSSSNLWTGIGVPLTGGQQYHLGTAWCFGDFELNPLVQADGYNASDNPGFSCDGSAQTNITQTDIVTGDIKFSAIQSRNNPDYLCGEGENCSLVEETWATSVVSYTPGLTKGGNPVLASRNNPQAATGPAEGTKAVGTFVSLGFGGSIVLEFDHVVEDLPGNDLSFHEITNTPYPDETADVEVSQNGVDWLPLDQVSNIGTPLQYLDIDGAYPWIKYVRITDTSNPDLHNNSADGYDLDGLDAANYNVCINPSS